MFSLNLTTAKPMNVIITSRDTVYVLHDLNANVTVYVSNVSLFFYVNFQAVFTPCTTQGAEWIDVSGVLVVKGNIMLIMQYT